MIEVAATLQQEFAQQLQINMPLVPRRLIIPNLPEKVLVAMGMRRVGKTKLLFQRAAHLVANGIPLERIFYVNFEDDRFMPHTSDQLRGLIEAFYRLHPDHHQEICHFFFDEIQNIELWPQIIRRLQDSKCSQIFLTGSSAKLLSTEIATALRGRSYGIEVFPFDFQEYLVSQNKDIHQFSPAQAHQDKLYQHFTDYLEQGGFPEMRHLELPERNRILQDYVAVVIFRDIIERHAISNVGLMKYLIHTLLQSAGCLFSVHKFYNDLKSQGFQVSKDTIYEYLRWIEDTYLAYTVPLYSDSLRKVQVNSKKIYLIDTGLINAHTLRVSRDQGHLFENMIYLDLRRQGYQIYYYLTKERYEVDFLLITPQKEIKLLQVVWDDSDPKVIEREQRALKAAELELNIKEGKIITPRTYLKHRGQIELLLTS